MIREQKIDSIRYDDVPLAASWNGFLSSIAVAAGDLPEPAAEADKDLYEDLGIEGGDDGAGGFSPLAAEDRPFANRWSARTAAGGRASGGYVLILGCGKCAMILVEYNPGGRMAAGFTRVGAEYLALRDIRKAGGRALSFMERGLESRIAVVVPVDGAIAAYGGADGLRRWFLEAVRADKTAGKPSARKKKATKKAAAKKRA